jgi:hypothetical protein
LLVDGDYDQFEADLTDIKCADNLVPEELRDALARDLDSIAALPDKDFHPGSEGMVCRVTEKLFRIIFSEPVV